MELLVSYNRQPFNVAQIPFEESHLVSNFNVQTHTNTYAQYTLYTHCVTVTINCYMHRFIFSQNYYVFSYRSAQAVVIVEHSSGMNNLYMSDETGTFYSLSLDDVVINNGYLDLELVSTR